MAALLAAVPAASANDASSAPTPLSFGVAAQANTTGFAVEPGEPNTIAPFPQHCNSGHTVGVARTDWYVVQGTGGPVTVTTDGSDYDTGLFAYVGSPAGGVVTCNDDISGSNLQSSISFPSTAGETYVIQAGRACNETGPPKCVENPDAGLLKILATSVAPNRDLDGDGFVGAAFGGPDCDDANAAIHEGAQDVPNDGIDQDCDGRDGPGPAALKTMAVTVTFDFFPQRPKKTTRFERFTVKDVPKGSSLVARCLTRRGKPCKGKLGKRFTKKAASGSVRLKRFAHTYRYGTRLEVVIANPAFRTQIKTVKIRRNKRPDTTTRCQVPGSPQRTSCAA